MIDTKNRIVKAFYQMIVGQEHRGTVMGFAEKWVHLLDQYDNVEAWDVPVWDGPTDMLSRAIQGDPNSPDMSDEYYERGSKHIAQARRYLTALTYAV